MCLLMLPTRIMKVYRTFREWPAVSLAQSLRNQADADDVVSEVFVSVLSVIAGRQGPTRRLPLLPDGRRPQRVLPRRTAARPQHPDGDGDGRADPVDGPRPSIRSPRDEVDLLQQALQPLPPTLREVLWRTEVEGRSHQEIADVTGSTVQAVAAQAMRARRALGGAYLQHHLPDESVAATVSPACSDTRRELAGFVRDSVSARARSVWTSIWCRASRAGRPVTSSSG